MSQPPQGVAPQQRQPGYPAPQPLANFFMAEDGRLRPGWRLTVYFLVFLVFSIVIASGLGFVLILTEGLEAAMSGGMNSPAVQLLGGASNLLAALLPAYLMWRFIDRR